MEDHAESCVDALGQALRTFALMLQEMVRDALRRLRADARQAAKCIDQGVETGRIQRRTPSGTAPPGAVRLQVFRTAF